jgi:chemotaxis protein MotB
MKESVSKQFGGKYQSPNQELGKFVTQVLEQGGIKNEVAVKSDPLGVSLVFQSKLFFDSLSAEVKPEGKAVLVKLIHELGVRQKLDKKLYQIVVEGHTDSRPVTAGPFPSNWELSGARASRVIRMFLDEKFSPDKLTAIGYADTRPEYAPRTAQGSYDEKALAKNRRVVLRILDPKVDSIPMPTGMAPSAPKGAAVAQVPVQAQVPVTPERAPAAVQVPSPVTPAVTPNH